MPDYVLRERDLEIIAAARMLLDKVAKSGHLRPAELVSVGKLLHFLACLPRPTLGMNVEVGVFPPEKSFPSGVKTHHYWNVIVEGDLLSISSGGYYNAPGTGSDSFTSLTWEAVPGEEPDLRDYIDRLSIVPDIQPMSDAVQRLDLSDRRFSVEVVDPENEFLVDDGDSPEVEDLEDDEDSSDAGWLLSPQGPDEERLAAVVNAREVDTREPQHAFGVERCDVCGRILGECGVFVDGQLRGQSMWANMCSSCFSIRGDRIGWGAGQLYARQPDGGWRLVAGFPPDD